MPDMNGKIFRPKSIISYFGGIILYMNFDINKKNGGATWQKSRPLEKKSEELCVIIFIARAASS